MAKKYFYHFIYYSHEVFIYLAMSRNFHFFAMRKAMSPLHKTKEMKKKTGNKPRTKATIYIKYDAEKAENLIGYATRWDIRRTETLNISRFIRMLTEKYKVTKSAFHETSGIHNMAFNKYLNVPDNCCLSTEAIERIAVCILLLEPPLNVDPDFEVDCMKKKGGFHGVIANMSKKNIDDMREVFRQAFGTFGYHLTHSIKSLDKLNELNVFYFNIFTNVMVN